MLFLLLASFSQFPLFAQQISLLHGKAITYFFWKKTHLSESPCSSIFHLRHYGRKSIILTSRTSAANSSLERLSRPLWHSMKSWLVQLPGSWKFHHFPSKSPENNWAGSSFSSPTIPHQQKNKSSPSNLSLLTSIKTPTSWAKLREIISPKPEMVCILRGFQYPNAPNLPTYKGEKWPHEQVEMAWSTFPRWSIWVTIPETNSSPLKTVIPNRKYHLPTIHLQVRTLLLVSGRVLFGCPRKLVHGY